jgi:hypothetical protein
MCQRQCKCLVTYRVCITAHGLLPQDALDPPASQHFCTSMMSLVVPSRIFYMSPILYVGATKMLPYPQPPM